MKEARNGEEGLRQPRGGIRWGLHSPFLLAAAVWTVTPGAGFPADRRGPEAELFRLAVADARGRIAHGLMYRRWASMHGGVYVPVSPRTAPNPYLKELVDERDITTQSGKRLTLVNPAYMTRQVHQLSVRDGQGRAHSTRLDPIRPGNAPDPWARKALKAFEGGDTLVSRIEERGGTASSRRKPQHPVRNPPPRSPNLLSGVIGWICGGFPHPCLDDRLAACVQLPTYD